MDEGADKVARPEEERDVVWMRGDARGVEGYEDVDRGCGRVDGFALHGVCEVGRKGRGEEGGYLGLVPGRGHAIWEFAVVVEKAQISLGTKVDEGQEGKVNVTYGLSTTKTSSSFRRPRASPLLTSSFFRVSPSPSASPVYTKVVRRGFRMCAMRGEGN